MRGPARSGDRPEQGQGVQDCKVCARLLLFILRAPWVFLRHSWVFLPCGGAATDASLLERRRVRAGRRKQGGFARRFAGHSNRALRPGSILKGRCRPARPAILDRPPRNVTHFVNSIGVAITTESLRPRRFPSGFGNQLSFLRGSVVKTIQAIATTG